MSQPLRLGIAGLGTVGVGVVKIIQHKVLRRPVIPEGDGTLGPGIADRKAGLLYPARQVPKEHLRFLGPQFNDAPGEMLIHVKRGQAAFRVAPDDRMNRHLVWAIVRQGIVERR